MDKKKNIKIEQYTKKRKIYNRLSWLFEQQNEESKRENREKNKMVKRKHIKNVVMRNEDFNVKLEERKGKDNRKTHYKTRKLVKKGEDDETK